MKISDVETFCVDADWRNWLFVRVKTDEGIEGIGEALVGEGLHQPVVEAINTHEHYIIGEDPRNKSKIRRKLTRYPFAWRGGKLINSVAAAVDIALWDITGKYYDEPVWRLLGGKLRDEIPVYGNGWHIGERTPENYAKNAKRAVNKGYPALKCDPFAHYEHGLKGEELEEVKELLQAIRDSVGWEVGLAIDAHGRFTRRSAIRIANEIEEFDIMFFEEPIELEDVDALASVNQNVNIPVAAGERLYSRYSMGELIRKQACDIVQPDLTNCQGLMEVKHIAAMADSRYMMISPHNPSSAVSTAAAVHVCAGLPNFETLEHMARDVPWREDVIEHKYHVKDGYIKVNKDPGLGIKFHEDEARKHPAEPKETHSLFEKKGTLKRP